MTKTGGFGICINNNDFEKAMYGMVIDYKADLQEMQKYYDQLLEHGLLIIISDSQGTQYVTSPQQVFNFEYKMWSRWNDNKNSKNSKNKKKAAEPAAAPAVEEAPKAVAPGAAGQLKMHDVEPKTAAMLMAIVADKMGKPLNELRFISIKEVK